ncbi:MAG: hypothetical protein ACSW8K_09945 [bacterium]
MNTLREEIARTANPRVEVRPIAGHVEAVLFDHETETGAKSQFGTMTRADAAMTEMGMVRIQNSSENVLAVYTKAA